MPSKARNIRVGAQNIGWAKEGAFTGEISGPMLNAVGVSHAIIGHSERRQYFDETDETVLKRTQAALEFGLTPIVCVGERLAERESGKTEAVLVGQFQKGIAGLTEQQFAKIVIAYEPVWAIGTGKTATPEIAADAHRAIRAQVREKFGKDAARCRPHSLRRQREARQREDPDGAAGNRRRPGGRRGARRGVVRVDRQLLGQDGHARGASETRRCTHECVATNALLGRTSTGSSGWALHSSQEPSYMRAS